MQAHAAGQTDVPGVAGKAVGKVDHRAHPRLRERAPLAQARERLAHARERGLARGGAPGAAVHDRQRGCARTESAGDADQVRGTRAVASDERARLIGPADGRDRDRQSGGGDHVAAEERRAGAQREGVGGAHELQRTPLAEVGRKSQHQVRLAGVGAHRREVRERGRERPVPDLVRGGAPVPEAEVDAVDHRVDRGDAHRSRTHHSGVVAAPAQHPRGGARARQLRRDGVDQGALGDACAQRWR